MRLRELCQSAGLPSPNSDVEISQIAHDSRQVTSGCLFVAIKGLRTDGHQFLAEVIQQGAAAVVIDNPAVADHLTVPYCLVDNSAAALGNLWAAWLDWPSRQLHIAGITGTDGKTTTSHIAHHLLHQAGIRAGLVSTLGAKIDDQHVDTGLHVTSPESPQLQQLLSHMVKAGLTHVIVEVTSHAISQHRIAGIHFDQAAVTNLTAEHLDYHANMDEYGRTKAQLFHHVNHAILNADDAHFKLFQQQAAGMIHTYSLAGPADARASQIVTQLSESTFDLTIKEQTVHTGINFPGQYNISNALAAALIAHNWGVPLESIAKALPHCPPITGRFEELKLGQPFRLIIDFAHTPYALQSLCQAIRPQLARDGKLWLVFGSAGQRDVQKRPQMGEIAGRLADFTIITTEDPRDEPVEQINRHIEAGLRQAGATDILEEQNKHHYQIITDRREAIRFALQQAKSGDIVLITGKGHEQSLAIGEEELPWNDVQVATELLRQ